MKTLITNKDARRSYEIIDTYYGGLVLSGAEVKSIKKSQGSLKGSFLIARMNHKQSPELFLKNMFVPPYQQKNMPGDYNPERMRTVLISKKEHAQIQKNLSNRGTTLIPLQIGLAGSLVKIQFAVARGLKKYDKREKIKKADTMREINREVKLRIR